MKVTFEFDTCAENFNAHEFECIKVAETLAFCLCEINDQLIEWYKYDSRGEISITEIKEVIEAIILKHINLEKLCY